MACRVALEYFSIIEDERLLENVSRVGAYLHERLKSLADSTPPSRKFVDED